MSAARITVYLQDITEDALKKHRDALGTDQRIWFVSISMSEGGDVFSGASSSATVLSRNIVGSKTFAQGKSDDYVRAIKAKYNIPANGTVDRLVLNAASRVVGRW